MDYEGHSYAFEPEQICEREEVVEDLEEINDSQDIVQDFDVVLINSIEKEKCLYQYSHPLYGKRKETNKAWDDVGDDVNKKIKMPEGSKVTVAYIKERWRQLRKQYSAERTRRKAESADLNKGFKLYEMMKFLEDNPNPKPKTQKCKKKVSIAPISTTLKKPRLQTRHPFCTLDNQNIVEQESVYEQNHDTSTKESEINKHTTGTDESCDNNTNQEIEIYRQESEGMKDLTHISVKKIQEFNILAQHKKLKQKLLEEKRKKIEEEALRKKELQKKEEEEEMTKRRSMSLNVACADSVAATLTALSSEQDRHELMAKIMGVLYQV